MPTYTLVSHPDYPPVRTSQLDVSARRRGDLLALEYRIVGGDRILWPVAAPAARIDHLWRTTCFELFLMFDDGERYVEFNCSPSTQWAAYAFDGYRDGMVSLALSAAPVIEPLPGGIAATLDLRGLPWGEHRMALSAVIEEDGGVKSYWALAHAPGPPDFHNPACFVATLPAPERA